jgi:hypothetical protein
VVAGTLYEVPPLTATVALNEWMKNYWEGTSSAGPAPHAADNPASDNASVDAAHGDGMFGQGHGGRGIGMGRGMGGGRGPGWGRRLQDEATHKTATNEAKPEPGAPAPAATDGPAK